MDRWNRRAIVLGAMTVVAVTVAFFGVAHADPPPFTENWQHCKEDPGHVVFNPLTGESIRVGRLVEILAHPVRPVHAWICVDTGGTAGSHSVGTATYVNQPGTMGATQHTNLCLGVAPSPCIQANTGIELLPPSAGTTGVHPCVSVVSTTCTSVGFTPSSSSPLTTSVHNPTSGGICGVPVAGTCVVQEATVTAGGALGTAYVGTTPTNVVVPQVTVCTNRDVGNGYEAVSPNLGPTCP